MLSGKVRDFVKKKPHIKLVTESLDPGNAKVRVLVECPCTTSQSFFVERAEFEDLAFGEKMEHIWPDWDDDDYEFFLNGQCPDCP